MEVQEEEEEGETSEQREKKEAEGGRERERETDRGGCLGIESIGNHRFLRYSIGPFGRKRTCVRLEGLPKADGLQETEWRR